MIRIRLTEKQKTELESTRNQNNGQLSERALAVLLSNDGLSPNKISQQIKRNPHTVRDWLKRYREKGIQGLKRHFSPGRPDHKRQQLKHFIPEVINQSPEVFGYPVSLWTSGLIADAFQQCTSQIVSDDTVLRAMCDLDYTYRRSKKTVHSDAPDKATKLACITSIIDNIKQTASETEHEIFALDESHFSTEPYIVSGWQKKV